jgi:phage internal scaffolding protein
MKSVIFCRSAFNYDRDAVSDESGLSCPDPSLAQQSFREEVDINTIVNRFLKTGVLPTPNTFPQYVDFEGVFDYQSAMNLVRAADESFMRMDAKVRARFNNSPQEFLEFFANAENLEEAIRLGLAIPQPSAVTQVTTEVTPSKAE